MNQYDFEYIPNAEGYSDAEIHEMTKAVSA